MVGETLDTVAKLQTTLILAEVFVSALPKDTPYQQFEARWLEVTLDFHLRLKLTIRKPKKSMVWIVGAAGFSGFWNGVLRKDGVIPLDVLKRPYIHSLRSFKRRILWTWRSSLVEYRRSLISLYSRPMVILAKQMFLVCQILVDRYKLLLQATILC